ncbi:galactose-specific lectin nattectin-like protein, partial [Leptotrombidium deliense]
MITTRFFLFFALVVLLKFKIQCVNKLKEAYSACRQYWYEFGTKCYYLNNTIATVANNFELCRSLNASMVSIHSEKENELLATILDSTNEYWLGGIQVTSSLKSFAWLDASVFNFSRWGQDQPNEHEHYFCVAIVFENGSWYDRSCNETRRQLCQKSVNTEPLFFSQYPQTYVHGLSVNQQELVDRVEVVEQFLKLREKSNFASNLSDTSLPRNNSPSEMTNNYL